jgi:hypothetical protein
MKRCLAFIGALLLASVTGTHQLANEIGRDPHRGKLNDVIMTEPESRRR